MDKAAFTEHATFETTHWWFLSRRHAIEQLMHAALDKSQARKRVVEIGCGTGANIASLANEYDCTGVDISHHAVAMAKEAYPDCDFIAIDELGDVGSTISHADVVLLLDVLEHVEDDFAFASELVQHMSPGAILILTVPADPLLWSSHDEALFHFRRYTADRLKMVFEGMPMTSRLLSGFNWRLARLIRSVRALKSTSRGSATRAPDEQESSSDLAMPSAPVNWGLKKVFSSEARALVRMLDSEPVGQVQKQSGVSLITVMQRTEGAVTVREKPANCPEDQSTPQAFDLGASENLAVAGNQVQ